MAVPTDSVAPWICEPTHSQSSGVPTHSPRLPMNMISASRTAPVLFLSRRIAIPVYPGSAADGGSAVCGARGPWLTDSLRRA